MKTTISTKQILRFLFAAIFISANISSSYAQGTGIVDSSFGKNGVILTKIATNRDDISQSITVTPDDKIVIAGNSFNILGYSNIGVIRYKANGALDKTFNGTGKRIINNAFCNVVIVQPDKKIVIGGSVAIGSNTVFGLWRLNSDGSNDNSFGTNGYQTVAFGGYVICFAMKLQGDGKILIGGNDGNFYAGNSSLILARLTAGGQLDTTFSGDGKFSLNLTRKSLTCNEILIQPDGKIIATGQLDTVVRPNFIEEFFATRLYSNGTIDSSFGNKGITRAKNSISDIAYCAGLLPDGRIIMGGYSKLSGSGNKASALGLTARGNIDKTFGVNGWTYPSFYGATAVLDAAAVQANGKIIFAGYAYNSQGISSAGITRLNGDGSQDKSFANNGVDTISKANSSIVSNDATLQKDGKLLITGYVSLNTNTFFTARFLNDQQFTLSNSNKTSAGISSDNTVSILQNPVPNNVVRLNLNLKSESRVSVIVYSSRAGQIIHTSFNAVAGLSEKTIQLPASIKNGNYVCVVKVNGETKTIHFMVLK